MTCLRQTGTHVDFDRFIFCNRYCLNGIRYQTHSNSSTANKFEDALDCRPGSSNSMFRRSNCPHTELVLSAILIQRLE